MKLTLSKKELREMVYSMQGTLEEGKNLPFKWKYALTKNIDRLEPELKLIDKLSTPSPVYNEYNVERAALAEKFADKDENGKPIFIGDNVTSPRRYKITNLEEFNKEWEALKNSEKYKEAVQQFEYTHSPEFQEETQEYDFHEIIVTKEEREKLEKNEIIIPGASFRYTMKIIKEAPDLKVV